MSGDRLSQSARTPYALALAGALIIMIFAFVNGYAVFFNDSRAYVRGPALAIKALTHKDFVAQWPQRQPPTSATAAPAAPMAATAPAAGLPTTKATQGGESLGSGFSATRSIYYGVLAFLGYLTGGFWLTVFVQALTASLPLAILSVRGLNLRPTEYLIGVTALSLLTTLGPISALIMPDIFAASMIAAVATLFVCWDRLRPLDIVMLLAAVAYAVLAHASHVVLLAAMVGGLAIWTLVTKGKPFRAKAIALISACVLIGVGGQIIFTKALEHVMHDKPLVLPHITAHLVDMGPGYRYLKANCSHLDLAVCGYLDRLPMPWQDFLGRDPVHGVFAVADLPTKHRLSDEQVKFAIGVLKYDPVGLITGLLKDGATQLTWFSLEDLQVTPAAVQNYAAAFPRDISSRIARSWIAQSLSPLDTISLVNEIVTVLALGVLGYLCIVWRPGPTGDGSRFVGVALIVVGGVVLNAFVCGMLASPFNRFQARVIWLIPMIALAGWAVRRRSLSAPS